MERPYAVGRICDVQDFEDSANLKQAFEFLRTADLKALKDGKVEIDGDNVFVNVSTVDLVPIDRDGDFEAHRQYIDIHVPLTEAETIGTHVLTERELNLPFDDKDDYVLYKSKGGSVTVKPGEFAVFFPPYGGHRPGCTMQKNPLKGHRKLCVKVRAGIGLRGLSQVYENPIPNIRSRQPIFPNLCERADGSLLCCFYIGEAMDAVDGRCHLAESSDGGRTWSKPWRMFPQDGNESEYLKCTPLGGNRLIALGYGSVRTDRDQLLSNPKTGGLLPHRVFCAFSEDNGRTWSEKRGIPESWHEQTEASAPVVRLKDGSLAAPITGFPNWEGRMTARLCGRCLRSSDEGRTWNDDVVCMDFGASDVSCYEQRFCVLDSGTVVNIGWNEDLKTGARQPNHITYSTDNARSFSKPIDTGVMGQAASLCALGGETFLAVVARRRDTDAPGVYGYVCDFSERKWNVIRSGIIWSAGKGPLKRDRTMAEVFGFLKFGQPSVIRLRDGRLMLCFWYQREGQFHVAVGEVVL